MITGEPMPVEKGANDPVIGATVNQTGSFLMRAENVGADTLLSQIVHMVAEAQRSRAPIQRLAKYVRRIFRTRCHPPGRGHSYCVGGMGTGSRHGLRHRERGVRANHRVPVRIGIGYSDVDNGGGRKRSSERHFDQGRRSLRKAIEQEYRTDGRGCF
jgi:E1-E2 ATPase